MVRRDRPCSKGRYTICSLLMPLRSRPVAVITAPDGTRGSFSWLGEAPEAETTEETIVITVARARHLARHKTLTMARCRANPRHGGTIMVRGSARRGLTATARRLRGRRCPGGGQDGAAAVTPRQPNGLGGFESCD